MPLKIADRVQVTATANTTVSFSLGAVVVGFRNFSFLDNGDTTYYTATDTTGKYEVGIGTYATSGTLLNRDGGIFASSNGGSAVNNFAASVNVFVTYPSQVAVITNVAQTLENKRITPRNVTSAAAVTPNADTTDQYNATALGSSVTIAAPTGTPTNGQRLTFRLVSNPATAPTTLTWNSIYNGMGIVLPTTLNDTTYIGCIYNTTTSKWDVTAVTGPL